MGKTMNNINQPVFEKLDSGLDEALLDDSASEIIVRIVNILPLPQRVCVFYYYHNRLSIAEIALQLAVTEDVVETRLAFAQKKIREELEKLEEEDRRKLPKAIPLAALLIPAIKYGVDSGLLSINAAAATAAPTAGTAGSVAATSGSSTGKIIAGIAITLGVVTCCIIAGVIIVGNILGNVVNDVRDNVIGDVRDSIISNVRDNVIGNLIPDEIAALLDDIESFIPEPVDTVELSQATAGDIVRFDKYNWRVLEIVEGRALILTENIIGAEYFHNGDNAATWAESDIRTYLNDDFLNGLDDEHRSKALRTTVHTPGNSWHGTAGGSDTEDYVFLLSVEEVVKYFGDSGQLESGGVSNDDNDENESVSDIIGFNVVSDEFNEGRVANFMYVEVPLPWMLRTPPNRNAVLDYVADGKLVTGVCVTGMLHVSGYPMSLAVGLRPAMWVEIY